MAIQIPGIVVDRPPHPEWGTPPPAIRYPLPAVRLLAALEAIATPAPLMEGLRALAAAGTNAELFVAAGRGLVQVLIDGRRLTLSGAVRDAVLAALGQPVRVGADLQGTPTSGSSTALADVSTAARAASIDAQVQESRTTAAVPVLAPPHRVPLALGLPLMGDPRTEDPGLRLAQAVDASGLFLEAHVAQWLRGERSLSQIQDEVRRATGNAPAVSEETAQLRGAQQLDAVQRQAFELAGPAWPGQSVEIRIERERARPHEGADAKETSGLFQATVTLHLPQLGRLSARIRVMENTVGVQIESDHAQELAAHLSALTQALASRGLNLAQLSTLPSGMAGA